MPSLPLSTPALIAYPTPLLGTVKNMGELYEHAPLDLREGFLRVPVSGSRDPYKVVGFADRVGYSEKNHKFFDAEIFPSISADIFLH